MSPRPNFRTKLSLHPFNPWLTQQFTHINKSMQDKLRHRDIIRSENQSQFQLHNPESIPPMHLIPQNSFPALLFLQSPESW